MSGFFLPVDANAQLIISEFRLRGPAGANDEFIEIYNNSDLNHTVSALSGTGYGLAASDGTTRCTIPNGSFIPARGHFLCINEGYSLGYPVNATYTTDIPDNAGIALFNNNTGGGSYVLANRMDAAGSTFEANVLYREGAGYPAIPPYAIDYSFTRRPAGGCTGSSHGNCNSVLLIQTTAGPSTTTVQDTNDNANDFMFVDTNGTNAGGHQRLGAPGPENSLSPRSTDGGFGLVMSRLDSCRVSDAPPNNVRDFTNDPPNNSAYGTLDIRRTFTNTSGGNITRLRFRVVDITTFPSITGVADLRARTSSDIFPTVDRPPCYTGTSNPVVHGTTVEQPPSQPNGSGYGGTLSVGAITVGTPLANGASIDVRFLLGIQQPGLSRFCVVAETEPLVGSQVVCSIGTTEGMVRHYTQNFSNPSGLIIPGIGTGDATGAPANLYPSNISVSGITNPVTKVTVTLRNLNHTWPDDVDVLLVGPTGVKLVLMSDVGGNLAWTGQTFTIDSSAAEPLPDEALYPSGTYKPTNFPGGSDPFPVPAPAGPYLSPFPLGTATLGVFNGLDPNGTWSLYVVDDAAEDIGHFFGGWDLTITTSCIAPLGAVESDFNGDCIGDRAVYRPSTGTWYVQGQADSQFGLPGDIIVPGDYSGNGLIERAVYRPSTGTWFVQGQPDVQWGLYGDIPVPADYNGDGTTDRAVYRPSNGTWYVLNGETAQFGLPGDIPVPGNYHGDGHANFAVFRPSTATWYVRGQSTVQYGLPGDIPVPGDYDGDFGIDRAVYRPSTGQWFVEGQAPIQWGLPGDIPVPSDFDGDGEMDLVVYRPSTGTWYTKLSTTNYTTSTENQFGLPGDIPIPNSTVAYVLARWTLATLSRMSDFDGDRTSDLTVFRPSNATWFTRRSSSDYANTTSEQWGLSGDVPVPHDYDGDGQTDFAVYRPSTGNWHILQSMTAYSTSITLQWGLTSDLPMPGDYDGDGLTDPAVYRPSTGQWLILKSSTGYTTTVGYQWGSVGDVPQAGDFDGDGISDLTVYRPSTGGWWTRFSSTGYTTSMQYQWGLSGDIPVPGEYDGDGITDRTVYRPSNGTWYVRNSTTNLTTTSTYQWGLNNDMPVPGDFDGDRKTDVAVWRPSNGTWYLLLSSSNFTVFDQIQWGLSSDVPILKRP